MTDLSPLITALEKAEGPSRRHTVPQDVAERIGRAIVARALRKRLLTQAGPFRYPFPTKPRRLFLAALKAKEAGDA